MTNKAISIFQSIKTTISRDLMMCLNHFERMFRSPDDTISVP